MALSAEKRRAMMFVLTAPAWSLGLFAVLRAPWVEKRLVLPLTDLQRQAAEYYAGRPAGPMAVTEACSGTDVLALCLAAVLACPVSWRARLLGCGGATAFVLGLNTVRIATLGRSAGSPALFEALHLQVWPAILVLATVSFVLLWMKSSLEAERKRAQPADVAASGQADSGAEAAGDLGTLVRRFAPRAMAALVVFALMSPWIARSETLLAAGAWTASAAALVLGAFGLFAVASANVLATSRGGFQVTPECLATALVPLYVAGVFTARLTFARRALALAAGLPVFTAFAVVRLLLLALPPAIAASPLFLVHGFHQLVLAVAAVGLLAWWREPVAPGRGRRAAMRAGLALGAAFILALASGAALTRGVHGLAQSFAAPHTVRELTVPGDAQGALALLPAFQVALMLALALTAFAGFSRVAAAFAVILVSQVGLLVGLFALQQAGFAPHALVLRAWSVALPIGLVLATLHRGRLGMGSAPRWAPLVHGAR